MRTRGDSRQHAHEHLQRHLHLLAVLRVPDVGRRAGVRGRALCLPRVPAFVSLCCTVLACVRLHHGLLTLRPAIHLAGRGAQGQ